MPESDKLILSPHQRFLAITPTAERAEFRKLMVRPDIQLAFILAYAELAARGASRDQMDGAQLFISIFQNFSEAPEKSAKLPQKNLQVLG